MNHLEHRKTCPLCNSVVTRDQVFPNFQRASGIGAAAGGARDVTPDT